jgi:alpha-amylase
MRSRLHALTLAAVLATFASACATTRPPELGTRTFTAGAAVAPPRYPSWANGAVFYEVFVRSFQDSNGDGKGDLKGLIARLDYLNDGDPATSTDLGVDALWLMPVFASPSYHGYDTVDYETINPDYGTNADFDLLLKEAHRRGIKIIVDLVVNHTGSGHPWFTEAASSPTSPRRDWYVWSATDPGWGQPWNASSPTWHRKGDAYYYGVFWSGMPDLNFRNPAVREEMKRVAALWLSRGVDGFRLDATRHLVETGPGDGQSDTAETHAFLKELATYVRSVKPDAVLVGENWTDTGKIAPYYGSTTSVPGGDELPLNFDFPLASRIIAGSRSGDATVIADKLDEVNRTYPAGATDVPFLTNHDMRRIASDLKDDPGKLRSAAAVLLTLPGAPFLYYGEEIGLLNGTTDDDESKRTPMPWDATPGGGFTTGKPWHRFAPGLEKTNVAAQSGDPASLLSHYRALIRARHASPALAVGRLEVVSREGSVLAFLRTEGQERVLVAHNLGDKAVEVPVAVAARKGSPLFATPGASVALADGSARLTLPANGSVIFRLDGTP